MGENKDKDKTKSKELAEKVRGWLRDSHGFPSREDFKQIVDLLDPPDEEEVEDGDLVVLRMESGETSGFVSVATLSGRRYFDGGWREWSGSLKRGDFRKATNGEIVEYVEREDSFTPVTLKRLGKVLARLQVGSENDE